MTDLKARLVKLQGTEPVKASVERRVWNSEGEGKKLVITQGETAVWVEEAPQSLKCMWNRDQIQKATTNDPATALKPSELEGYFNGSERLMKELSRGKFTEERADMLDGKPVRLLVFSQEPTPDQRKAANSFCELTLRVWIDAEGTPVAMRQHWGGKGRVLLAFSFEGESNEDYRFARIGNRLVTLRHESEYRVSASNAPKQVHRQMTTLRFP
ncbi:MAG TPA: hypothetical protein PKL14_12515 [Holophaga sp.]|nr:hypothetical protein [Holophaga sp.]